MKVIGKMLYPITPIYTISAKSLHGRIKMMKYGKFIGSFENYEVALEICQILNIKSKDNDATIENNDKFDEPDGMDIFK